MVVSALEFLWWWLWQAFPMRPFTKVLWNQLRSSPSPTNSTAQPICGTKTLPVELRKVACLLLSMYCTAF